jgi:hypothetical protein
MNDRQSLWRDGANHAGEQGASHRAHTHVTTMASQTVPGAVNVGVALPTTVA